MRNVELHDYELYVNLNTTFLNLNIHTLVLFSQNFPTWQRKKKGSRKPPKGLFHMYAQYTHIYIYMLIM